MNAKKKYFRLYPEVIYQQGSLGGALYLLVQKRVYSLDDLRSSLIKKLESNSPVEEAAGECGLSGDETEKFLSVLQEVGAGSFIEFPCFVEKVRPSNPVEDITFFRPAPRITMLHITVSGGCDQKCSFCLPGQVIPRLQACLGCRRVEKGKGPVLEAAKIRKVIYEAGLINCQSLRLHAGNPNLTGEAVLEAVMSALKNNYKHIEVVTGTALTHKLLNKLVENGVMPVYQIYSYQAAEHDRVTGIEGSFSLLEQNLLFLNRIKGAFKLIYLYTGNSAGDNQEPNVVYENLKKYAPTSLYCDRLANMGAGAANFISGPQYFVPPDIEMFMAKQKGYSCMYGKLALNYDGKYYSCPASVHELGNIAEITVQELFSRGKILEQWQEKEKIEICRECEFSLACHRCKILMQNKEMQKCVCGYEPETARWL